MAPREHTAAFVGPPESTVILIVFLLLQFVSVWFSLFFTVQLAFYVDDT